MMHVRCVCVCNGPGLSVAFCRPCRQSKDRDKVAKVSPLSQSFLFFFYRFCGARIRQHTQFDQVKSDTVDKQIC